MSEKGFESEVAISEAPNFRASEEKPLIYNHNRSKKVDINVLKARVQATQNKENKKNVIIFLFFLILIGALGIFLSS